MAPITKVILHYVHRVNKGMLPFRGKASWAKMTSPKDKLIAPACYPSKKVNKAEELTNSYLKKSR
jgi:hypothetical protein